MNKKVLAIILAVFMLASVVAGCGGGKTEPAVKVKIGMVTDAGTIDDKSFNQGTWEGIQKAEKELGVEIRYLKPVGTTEADYIREISNLVDAGFNFIVCPGYKFETAIFQTQERYPDVKFVIIDGSPHSGDYNNVVGPNTVAVFFAEEESGFLAGVATALQLEEGKTGFVGGMEVPAVQKFNWGFQQGLAYANENYGTKVTIEAENVIYQGSFDNVAAGQQLAAQMYDKGVDAIFAAAGGVGVGVINEAKSRANVGEEIWVVGVDVDQYSEGIYAGEKSAVLTSAVKGIDVVTYNMIEAYLNDKFPGGETQVYNAENDGIGIPKKNPNLKDEVEAEVAKVYELIQKGTIVVQDVQGELIK